MYNTKKIPYQRQPTAKRRTANWRKRKERTDHLHLTNPTVPYPPLQNQKEKKIRTVPPPTPPKCTIKIVPARHFTQRKHTHKIYMTRLAREIPTDPAHPINKKQTYKDEHTPLTEEQKTNKKSGNLHSTKHTSHSNSQMKKLIQIHRRSKKNEITIKYE